MKRTEFFKTLWTISFMWCAWVCTSQIPSPEFHCVRNDTLFWDVPVVDCGVVNSYEIYASTDPDGPYSLLDMVPDLSADLYFHVNPSGETYYYYLRTNADCPGEQALHSDTLDNRPPPEVPIDYVSVINGKASIGWTALNDPDILGYVVYRASQLGTVAIDTVFSGTVYVDNDSDPNNQIEFYYINGIDNCGITSFFDIPHHTILLDYEVDSCEQTAQLLWNAYDTWPEGVDEYRIMVSEDGAPFEVKGQVGGNTTSFALAGLDKNKEYAIHILAKRQGKDDEAASNTVTFQPDIVQTLEGINLFKADIGDDEQIHLAWTWDPTAQLDQVEVIYYLDGDPVRNMILTDLPTKGLQVLETWDIGGLDLNAGPYVIIIKATDSCGKVIESNLLYTIFISGRSGSDQANNIIWNSPLTANRLILTSELYRLNGSSGLGLIAALPVTTITYVDNTPNLLSSCYQILVGGEVNLFDGTVHSFEQHSNLACLSKPVRFYMPNAISPKGTNRILKPSIINGANITEYSLSIFDRWGNRIFHTIHPLIGWDGTANGKYVSEGVYIYRLQINQSSDEKIDQNGTIHLIY